MYQLHKTGLHDLSIFMARSRVASDSVLKTDYLPTYSCLHRRNPCCSPCHHPIAHERLIARSLFVTAYVPDIIDRPIFLVISSSSSSIAWISSSNCLISCCLFTFSAFASSLRACRFWVKVSGATRPTRSPGPRLLGPQRLPCSSRVLSATPTRGSGCLLLCGCHEIFLILRTFGPALGFDCPRFVDVEILGVFKVLFDDVL